MDALTYLLLLLALAVYLFFFSVFLNTPKGKMFAKLVADYRTRNKLYTCEQSNCRRHYRLYQWRLYADVKKLSRCPHCERVVQMNYRADAPYREASHKDAWLDLHPDCFRVNTREYWRIRRSAKLLREQQAEHEVLERFVAYNELERGENWIHKLNVLERPEKP